MNYIEFIGIISFVLSIPTLSLNRQVGLERMHKYNTLIHEFYNLQHDIEDIQKHHNISDQSTCRREISKRIDRLVIDYSSIMEDSIYKKDFDRIISAYRWANKSNDSVEREFILWANSLDTISFFEKVRRDLNHLYKHRYLLFIFPVIVVERLLDPTYFIDVEIKDRLKII